MDVQHIGAMLHEVTFARPEAFYLLAIPAVVLLWSLIGLRSLRGIFAPLMRALALALFVLALAGPEKIMREEGATRPAVIDVSASITPAMRAWGIDLISNQLKLRGSDPAMLFGSENHPTSIQRRDRNSQDRGRMQGVRAECDQSGKRAQRARRESRRQGRPRGNHHRRMAESRRCDPVDNRAARGRDSRSSCSRRRAPPRCPTSR